MARTGAVVRRLAVLAALAGLAAACAAAGPEPTGAPTSRAAAPAASAPTRGVAAPSLKVGAPAPDFALPDVSGRPVSLTYYRGQRHIVLVFYIGHT